MADAVEHMTPIRSFEKALLALRGRRQKTAVGGTLNHERRDRNRRCIYRAFLQARIARVRLRLAPADAIGMERDRRPIGVGERRGRRLEILRAEPVRRTPALPLGARKSL